MKHFAFLSLWASLSLVGQNKKLCMADCIDFALSNNEHLKTAQYDIDYQKQFKKASTEIPKTSVVYTQGQFNSAYKYDNSITLSQQIPFPAVFAAHNALGRSYIKGSEYKLAATRADLIYQVKKTYYSLLYHYSIQHLLQKEDSIYESFAKAGLVKFEQGAGSLLEKTTSETKVMEIKNLILENEADINADKIQLQTLLNSEKEEEIVEEALTQKPLSMSTDSGSLANHPYLLYLNQQIIAGRKVKQLELYKIFPDLQVGYFNLSIFGPADFGRGPYVLTRSDRMQGFTVGVNVPLWFYPQSTKIKAAELHTRIAQSEYNYNKDLFEGQFDESYTLYLKYQSSISFYKKSALINSKAIIKEAARAYEAKEIGYVDYLTVVSNALTIESNYLHVIHQNNMAVLKLQYLLSK